MKLLLLVFIVTLLASCATSDPCNDPSLLELRSRGVLSHTDSLRLEALEIKCVEYAGHLPDEPSGGSVVAVILTTALALLAGFVIFLLTSLR